MVYEKIWLRYSSERPYLFLYKRGGSIHILGLLRHFLWVRLTMLVMDEMSLEVWNSAWASCMQMNEMFLFLVTKVTRYFLFSQEVNSIGRHASLLLVLRKCFRGDETILIWKSSNVYNRYRQWLFCCCYMQI